MQSSIGGLGGDWEEDGEVGEMGNGGRDDGAGRGEVGMNEEGTGNEGGRVGYVLGEDNKTGNARMGEGEDKCAVGISWAGD